MSLKCKLFGLHQWHLEAVSKHTLQDQFERDIEHYSLILQKCIRCRNYRETKVSGHYSISTEEDKEVNELRRMAGLE